jgi:hypothetical protein
VTALKEHQFEILPSADAMDGFVFGIGAEVSLDEDGFDPGEAGWLSQDGQNTRRGVRGFGRDVRDAKTWIWSTHTDQEDVETAADVLDRFSAAWSPEDLARQPGALTAVRYRLAGRDRRVFGRPRRFSAPPTNRILGGYVPITHDFDLVDSFTYDDVESSVAIPYSTSTSGGGFTLPAVMPIATQATEGVGSGQLTIGGRARAYPIIRFSGPWTNPSMTTDHWTLRWTGEIGPNGWVEIDARPWALTVLDQDGASAVEGLSRATWLEDIWFAAQSQPGISLSGSAASGGAVATVRWRNTWTSI